MAAPTSYSDDLPLPLPLALSPSDSSELSLLNPDYLTSKTIAQLRTKFVEESQLVLGKFLREDVTAELESLIRDVDTDGEAGRRGAEVGGRTVSLIPSMDLGEGNGWELVGPPHIQRFLALSASSKTSRLSELLLSVHNMILSSAFRAFLASITSVLPLSHTTHVRRFRPGLDYTLARGEPESGDHRLDVGLGLSPEPKKAEDSILWDEGEVGGWEFWLATEEGGDEATYGGGGGAKKDEEEEDEGPLLALQPAWNTLTLVLRDPGVLKFVKYVSARAPASRWDVGGEWEIAMVEEDEEAEEETKDE